MFGTWTSIESEIATLTIGSDAYHFYPPNIIVMEYMDQRGSSQVQSYRFEADGDGFRYGASGDLRFFVACIQIGPDMLWRPSSHGKSTMVRRISEEEFPTWIRGHVIAKRLAEQAGAYSP